MGKQIHLHPYYTDRTEHDHDDDHDQNSKWFFYANLRHMILSRSHTLYVQLLQIAPL